MLAEQPRRSTRANLGLPPSYLNDYVRNTVDSQSLEPRSFKEALNSEHSDEWKQAMKEELDSIEANNTWELVDLPQGRKAIGSKWVYKTKRDANGNVLRHKARLVAQEFTRKFGIDYDEVFAPVARGETFRMLLSVAGSRKYYVKQYDIKSAFLNGTLEEELYMKQPPGFQEGSKVLKLRKSIYGLKQSARVWNQTLHEALEKNGCKQNPTDKCLYVWKQDENVCYILFHVDDLLTAGNNEASMTTLMDSINK